MDAQLYDKLNTYIGTIILEPTRMFPIALYLDETPQGSKRLFIHTVNGKYKECPDNVPTVRLKEQQ
jgi:hypothetical protein